ncbi:hypothetical protein ABZ942_08280 [Nocardia sp. NPDC046473]|uniref:hypothetical protein n=1 Tax=Nocardia sp. NPDC046473 TaxID=3155733 RepID=UPI0033E31926
MSYPQYPGGYNPYPAYSPGMSAPSGATAITAGVLACVGAVGELFSGGISVVFGIIGTQLGEYDKTGLFSKGWFQTWAIVTGAIGLLAAVLLGVGAVAMFTRKSFGRMLVVVGCVVVVIAGIVGSVLFHSLDTSTNSLNSMSGRVGGLFSLIFPIATAILALLPQTSRWLAYTPVAAVPQQYGYPYPGGAQPGTAWPTQPGAAGQVDGQPQPAWGQPGQAGGSVPAGQATWQQAPSAPPVAGSPAAPAWQQPGQAGGPVPAGQATWQQAPSAPAVASPPAQPAHAWQQRTTDEADKQSAAPQPAWGVPAQPGPSAPDQPQPAWGTPAQPAVAPNGQATWPPPQGAWGVPAQPAIGRNDETVLRPPTAVPSPEPVVPPPADDTVWRPPPA